jgi:hypothetical protein
MDVMPRILIIDPTEEVDHEESDAFSLLASKSPSTSVKADGNVCAFCGRSEKMYFYKISSLGTD